MIIFNMTMLIMILFNMITITLTVHLLQGTPSDGFGKRREERLGMNEDFVGSSHEYGSSRGSHYGSHPQGGSHRGARTDSDLESPDAGDPIQI